MPFPMRRIMPGVVILTALLLTAAIACGPSAEQTPASENTTNDTTTTTSPTEAPAAAAASSGGTAEQPATTQPSGDTRASESSGTTSQQPTAAPESQAQADPPAAPANPPAAAVPVATDIPAIEGIDAWLNTEMELQIGQLAAEGKVVLVDFWTYTCINCIRTLPFLRDWWAQYEDDGLVILGIHTPEFEFEKDYQNVADAIDTHSVGWPVAQDNHMTTWRNFENRYWPAKYLYNIRGEMIYSHFGEGAYAETEERIRNALVEAGADLSDDPFNPPQDQARDEAWKSSRGIVTPELYAGWHRNFLTARAGRPPYVAQQEYFDAILNADDRGQETTAVIDVMVPQGIQPHKLYFQGEWSVEPERIRHARVTEDLEDYLALNYAAKSVNAVLTSDSGEPYEVVITVDGAMLTPENAGEDIQWDDTGVSFVSVNEPRMYALIDNPGYMPESFLTMRSNSDDFGLFAFTFGVYAEGP